VVLLNGVGWNSRSLEWGLFTGRDETTLLLQVREAQPSVLSGFGGH
jgi:hypothetical protein